MKYSKRWEQLDEDTYRRQIPTGWIILYVVRFIVDNKCCAVSATMHELKDPNHEWELKD